MPLSLAHASWLQPFAQYLSERARSVEPYCHAVHLEPKLITSGEGWITKQQLYGFLNAVARGEKMPEIGFVVGERLDPESVGGLGPALQGSQTLGEVIRKFCQLIHRSSEENRAWVEESDVPGEVWLFNQTTNPFPADRRIADHAGLMTMILLVRLAGGKDWYPERVRLQTEGSRAHRKVAGLRDAEVIFDAKATGLAFPAEWLLRQREGGDEKTSRELSGLLGDAESFESKLRLLIENLLGVGGVGPTAALMAELCGMGLRTLHRKLAESGTSYRALVEEIRLARAEVLLTTDDYSVSEIATQLGYSGANNFIRAFKRLMGKTPNQYRAERR